MIHSSSPWSLRPHLRLLWSAALLLTLVPGASAQAVAAADAPSVSRFDVFGGYSYFRPFSSDIANFPYPAVPLGVTGSVAGYFGSHFGLQVEGNFAPNGPADNNCVYTAQAGPIFRLPRGRFVPFVHALGGGAIVGGPKAQGCNTWGYGGTAGGGLDIILPLFHERFAVRPIQADFLYARIDNGPLTGAGYQGGVGQVTAVRGSAGLVLRLGGSGTSAREAPSMNCSADPGNPQPGDPVTITASTDNLDRKSTTRYEWMSNGGKVPGQGPVVAINTTAMPPGTYAVTGRLVEGSKERLVASCSTSFTVRAAEPPTVTCTADRAAIHAGDPVLISATAQSPAGRPLTYSYAATNGIVAGTGTTATLSTAGASPGTITVTCNVTDDGGKSASAKASIVVATPTPSSVAVVAHMLTLCSITFDRDRKRPNRVDNEGKGCLDDVALSLNRDPAVQLLIVGTHSTGENNRNAAERAMNAAQYLTDEKGIDAARLDLRIGPDSSRSVRMMLVPPGVSADDGSATSFDRSSVKRLGEAYGKPGSPRRSVRKGRRRGIDAAP